MMSYSISLSRSMRLSRLIVGGLIIVALLVGAFALSTLSAHAAGKKAVFGLQPVRYDPANPITKSYFVFNSNPGENIDSQVRVVNNGDATGFVMLYPIDATTGQTSGTVYGTQGDPRRDVGAWTTLDTQKITLAPTQSQVVSFHVHIPSGVRPGQHVGGIVAQGQSYNNFSNKSLQVNVVNLAVLAVQVNLPGPQTQRLIATGLQSSGANGYQTVLVGLHNTGNVMFKSRGAIQIADDQGHLLQTVAMNLDTFLPQTAINYPAYVHSALAAGNYIGTLDLTYGNNQQLHYSSKFTVTQAQLAQIFRAHPLQAPGGGNFLSSLSPWQIVVGVLLLVLVGSGVYSWVQRIVRRIRRSRKSSTGSEDNASDTQPGTSESDSNKGPMSPEPPPFPEEQRREERERLLR